MILNAIEVNTSEEKTTTHPFFISLPTFIFLRKCHAGSLSDLFSVNISTAESFAWSPQPPVILVYLYVAHILLLIII